MGPRKAKVVFGEVVNKSFVEMNLESWPMGGGQACYMKEVGLSLVKGPQLASVSLLKHITRFLLCFISLLFHKV